MAHTIPFDTHAYVKKLRAVGVPEAQAEVQAEAIADLVNDQLATKLDIQELKRDIEELKLSTKRDIQELELRLKHDLTLRFGGMLAAAVAVIAALVKLL